eukprot:4850080-Prymnesium_polylepis.1
MWTARMGCNPLTMFQGAQRYGRSKDAPLRNDTVDILLDCIPPKLEAVLNQKQARPTFDDQLRVLYKRRGFGEQAIRQMMHSIGGRVSDARGSPSVSDALIRLMAHGKLEEKLKRSCHHELVKKICEHHGWSLIDYEERCQLKVDSNSSVALDGDDDFASCWEEIEKIEWALAYVLDLDGFFTDCYGKSCEETRSTLSGRDKFFVEMFYLLLPFGRLPDGDDPVQVVKTLRQPGVAQGCKLNAHSRCLTPAEQDKRDAEHQLGEKRAAHTMLQYPLGARLHNAIDCAALLGVPSIFDPCDLPQLVLDIANREKKTLEAGDRIFLTRLNAIGAAFSDGAAAKDMVAVLKSIAKGCGMGFDFKRVQGTTRADRSRRIVSMSFTPLLPKDMMDDYLVYSERLQDKVAVARWHTEHAKMDEEEQQLRLQQDVELDGELFLPPDDDVRDSANEPGSDDTRDVRTEKIDGVALASELQRLRSKLEAATLNEVDERWLNLLEAADAAALPRVEKGSDPPPTRRLTVTYGKRRAIGRRVASHPSYQPCPSSLR